MNRDATAERTGRPFAFREATQRNTELLHLAAMLRIFDFHQT